MKINTCAALVVLFFAHFVWSEIRFSVSTERTGVVLGEQIPITATIVSDKELRNLAAPPVPQSEYYSVLRTSSNSQQSSSIQIINGRMSQTVEITYLFTYIISINKEGSFTFPSLTLSHDGKSYSSAPLPFTVGKEPVQSKDILVSLLLNKRRIYVGEQCVLTVEIAKLPQAPLNLTNQGFVSIIQNLENAFGKSFSINRLFTDKVGQSQRRIDGVVYQTFALSFSVIPVASGAFSIPPVPFEYVELRQVRSRDAFDDFFGGSFFGRSVQQVPKTALSNRISLEVAALPPAPPDFSGAVGNFALESSVNQTAVPSGEAITLLIQLKGNTRPGNMPEIKLPDMTDIDIFTPEKHVFVDTTAAGISTRVKLQYLIIPQQEGDKTVPSLSFTYFDPNKAVFKTATTPSIALQVSKGKKGSKGQTRYLTQEDIREVGRDIRYIKTPAHIKHQSTQPHRNPLFFALFPLPFCIALFSLLYRMQATILRKDPSLLLRRRALKTARLSLKTIRKNFQSGTAPGKAIAAIAETIETYISQRFGFSAIGKTLDALKEELAGLQVDQSLTDALIPMLEELDRFRFGGVTADKNTVQGHLRKADDLIEKLERKENKS